MKRRRNQRDFEEEIRAHLALEADQLEREGLSGAEARRGAQLHFGNVAASYDWFQESSRWRWIDQLARDARVGVRGLRKLPVFTVAAALALALGIGATTAMLSVVRSVLLEPLPYASSSQLVVALHNGNNPVAPANFIDWRAQTHSFAGMAAAEYWTPDLTGNDDPQQIDALHITSGMLPLLGVAPLLGREFTADEELSGNEHVVILSYGLWQERFAGDRGVVGQTMSLDGTRYTVVGVMPKTFQFAPFWATHAELWAPLALGKRLTSREGQSLRVFARLGPGVTLTQARADLAAVTARLEREYPGTNRNVELVPLKEKVVGRIETPLVVLLVAVAFVLLIACSNVAHMLLARAATRHRELAIRCALGATRGRLIAQMLVESMLLALVGGAGGFALAIAGIRALVAASPAIIPRVATVSIDASILVATFAITVSTAVAFGLLPALQATRVDLAETFRDGDRAATDGRGRGRMRGILVVSEFALALVLLVGAGLMIRTFVALRQIDPGFDPRNVISMIVSPSRSAVVQGGEHFYIDALARVDALPGVAGASYINHLPIAGDEWRLSFNVEGRPRPKPGDSPAATYRVVFPGYFKTMRIPILAGRDITDADRVGGPGVVVVNQFMANRYWPEGAIGKRISIDDSTLVTIVGVVKNDVRGQWAAPPAEEMFLPFMQQKAYLTPGAGPTSAMTLVARVSCERSDCDAAALATPIRRAIRSVDRGAPISAVETMSAVVATATAEQRFYLVLLAAFAGIAVVLAGVGIYGVMSYSVSRRTHEIGIRIALGAEPSSVVRAVVGRGVGVAAIGAGVGLVLAVALTGMMKSILYGVSPTDTVTFASVTSLLLGVALAASLVPALRATRADPLAALRSD
jgi:putative ABC transport system permease protein